MDGPDTVEIVGQLVANLGIVGVLVWFLWYNTTIAVPKKDQAFREQLDKMTERHLSTTQKIAEDFETCIREERAARRQDIADLKSILQRTAG
jgi:hypothetical protein